MRAVLRDAARGALEKKASDVVILDVRRSRAIVDYFLIASGTNQRQIVAIADAMRETLREQQRRPLHVEGYPRQEWILLDYGDFVVHIFTERQRTFYNIERLWSDASREQVTE